MAFLLIMVYNIKAMKREDIVVPQKKKQHYIPKTLLKRFSINKKCFIYNLKSNEVIDNAVSYEDQCYANYMYGSDLKIENELAEIESDFSAILDFVIINNSLPVEEERIKKLSRYIILQWLRTESAVDRFQTIAKDTMCSFLPSVLSYYKIGQENFDVEQYVGEYITTTFPRQQVAVHNVECSLSSDLNISDLKLCILKNATDINLVLSDDLVIVGNDFQPEYGLGANCPGVYFYMPISPDLLLLLYDSKMYKIKKCELSINEIEYLNYLQLAKARKILIGKNKESLSNLKKTYDSFIFNDVFKFFQHMGWKDPILINRAIPRFIAAYAKIYGYPRVNLPLKINPIIAMDNAFTPYKDNPQRLFFRGDLNEYLWKKEYWGNDFSKLVYDTYLSK